MSDDLFSSAWRKWGRAVGHADTLKADIERFAADPDNEPVITAETEYQPHRHAFAVRIGRMTEFPVAWGLILGDIASNYRAALDHTAWAMVCRGRRPPDTLTEKQQRRVIFPIAKSPKGLTGQLPERLPGAGRADIAFVRRYQPYHRGKRVSPLHALSILARLNNHDKHRTVQPTWLVPQYGACQVIRIRDCVVTDKRVKARTQPFQVGTEIRTVRVRRAGPQPELDVEVEVTGEVSLYNLVSVRDWLAKTEGWIGMLLWELAAPPVGVADRAALWTPSPTQ